MITKLGTEICANSQQHSERKGQTTESPFQPFNQIQNIFEEIII